MNMMTELKDVRNGHALREKMRIAGTQVGNDRSIDVHNPYTGTLVGTVPKATVDDLRRAFAIAKGFRSPLTRHDRYRILYRTAEIIRSRTDEISDLITAECGSGLSKSVLTVEGSVIGTVTKTAVMTLEETIKFKAIAGLQQPEQFEEGVKDTLLLKLVAGTTSTSEQAGLTATLKLKNEEEMEIKAKP